MKKEYHSPIIKVTTISSTHMLCTSDVNFGKRYDDPDYEYIEGETGGGYSYGAPD